MTAPRHAADPLRPRTLSDFGGQPTVARQLDIILGAARDRDELCDHILLYGPPGLGKTSLAHIVAAELDVPVRATAGPALEAPKDLAGILAGLPDTGAVLFIDEIHRLRTEVAEMLYPAMEDNKLDFVIGEGAQARVVSMPLPPFVLVGATTLAGSLPGPLRDRFGYTGRLRPYTVEALSAIVERSATLLDMPLTGEAARTLAARSRGTPRVANMLLRRVRDYAAHTGTPDCGDVDMVTAALEVFEIDELGLNAIARDLLVHLCDVGQPVGLNALASAVGEAPGTIEEMYEPWLVRAGLLARTPRGRVATAAAYTHLGRPAPADGTLPTLTLVTDDGDDTTGQADPPPVTADGTLF